MKTVYGMDKDSVWWVASDMGWVVGHSYICYGPLLYGATSVMYEGKPDRTPDAAQYFRFKHLTCILFPVNPLRCEFCFNFVTSKQLPSLSSVLFEIYLNQKIRRFK